jgi:hypothetical protein
MTLSEGFNIVDELSWYVSIVNPKTKNKVRAIATDKQFFTQDFVR